APCPDRASSAARRASVAARSSRPPAAAGLAEAAGTAAWLFGPPGQSTSPHLPVSSPIAIGVSPEARAEVAEEWACWCPARLQRPGQVLTQWVGEEEDRRKPASRQLEQRSSLQPPTV